MKFKYFSILFAIIALPTYGDVIIKQIMYDSPWNEVITSLPYSNGEFVELFNTSSNPVNIYRWTLNGDGDKESYEFGDVTIPAQASVIVAYRHLNTPDFSLPAYYEGIQNNSTYQIIYQRKFILKNSGETLKLCNRWGTTMDSIYYDGTSHKTKPDRLEALNEHGIPYMQCKSLQRIQITKNDEGKIVGNNADWITAPIIRISYEGIYDEVNSTNLGNNYILTITPMEEVSDIQVSNGTISANGSKLNVTYNYFNERGKITRSVAKSASPSFDDIEYKYEYDAFGNIVKEWLPIPVSTPNFYADPNAYTQYTYETIENGQLLSQTTPGSTYQTHPANFTYGTNGENEVIRWIIQENKVIKDGYYASGSLVSVIKSDEDNKTTTQYKDISGNIILTRIANDIETYNVYDLFGNLRYVLPAGALELMQEAAYDENDEMIAQYAYVYRYDSKGNMIYKKLPGQEPIYYKYNAKQWLLRSQDGNQRERGTYWTQYSYDTYGRLTKTEEIDTVNTSYHNTLIENYYDNYNFRNTLALSVIARSKLAYYSQDDFEPHYASSIGLQTGQRIFVIGDTASTVNANYYNYKGELILHASVGNNLGNTQTYYSYNFDGTIKKKKISNTYMSENYIYQYDHIGRPTSTSYQLNQGKWVSLSQKVYDEVGRTIEKRRHNDEDIEQYTYDVHGNLTIKKSGDVSEYLWYERMLPDGLTPNYNGNVSAIEIHNENDMLFGYLYDNKNRLIRSQFYTDDIYPSEIYEYDKMGNITSLKRYHEHSLIDDLEYRYDGNQIKQITDFAGSQNLYNIKEYNDLANSIDDANWGGEQDEQGYDANGNLIFDLDRNISAIRYNILNLADTIQFSNGSQIINRYDAAGNKRETTYITAVTPVVVAIGQTIKPENIGTIDKRKILYLDNLEVSIDDETTPQLDDTWHVYNPEGYYIRSLDSENNLVFTQYYNRTDHLGNILAIWDATNKVTCQRTFYYASGLPMQLDGDATLNDKLYNGHEYIQVHGYDIYDYGFRGYYATIGRFTSIDPLCENTLWQNPYTYANNNPINNIDLWGAISYASSNYNLTILNTDYVVIFHDLSINTGVYIYNGDNPFDKNDFDINSLDYLCIGFELPHYRYERGQKCMYSSSIIDNYATIPYSYRNNLTIYYGKESASARQIATWITQCPEFIKLCDILISDLNKYTKIFPTFISKIPFASFIYTYANWSDFNSIERVAAVLKCMPNIIPQIYALEVEYGIPIISKQLTNISFSYLNIVYNPHTYGF